MADESAIRDAARLQRERAVWVRHQARRQRRQAEAFLDTLIASAALRALEVGDLAELDEVAPQLRLVRGGVDEEASGLAPPRRPRARARR